MLQSKDDSTTLHLFITAFFCTYHWVMRGIPMWVYNSRNKMKKMRYELQKLSRKRVCGNGGEKDMILSGVGEKVQQESNGCEFRPRLGLL